MRNDLENAKQAYEFAMKQAEIYGGELDKLLQIIANTKSQALQDSLENHVANLQKAYENWMKSANMVSVAMRDITKNPSID